MGKHQWGTPYIAFADHTDKVVFGEYCSFARGSIVIAAQGHIAPKPYANYWVSTYPVQLVRKHGWRSKYSLPNKKNFVIIGNDVWVGANSIILPGVTIGDGAIIGAGAVVSHDVPPYAVVAGVPGRILRYRYTQQQIKQLLKIAWWNWPEQKIYDNMDYFFGDVETFIQRFIGEKDVSQ
jgi:acetyltransferase-like isoleucine patch superfamily enzyme